MKNEITKFMDKPVVVGTVFATASMTFNRSDACRLINQHFLGNPNCNYIDPETNKLVPIEHPNRNALEAAHQTFTQNHRVKICADVMSDGTLKNFRVAT